MTDLLPFAPIEDQILARQFLGELDAESSPVVAPNVGTFLGLPVREEPFSHRAKPVIPAPPAPQIAAPPTPLIELAVLVPTPLGGVPAFTGDWIVQAADGTWSVYTDAKFRAKFEAASRASQEALSADGSGTGRWGGHDNWTFHGDGTQYPPAYGIDPNMTPAPFVPIQEPPTPASEAPAVASAASLTPGGTVRILRDDNTVDPQVHVVKWFSGTLVTYEENGETLEVNRDHVVAVKA
jgi:hypothetical protein